MDNFNTTIHAFTDGLRALPTDDIVRVQHFLNEYLGDARHPVPFGGRAQDLVRLDSWLTEREGSPYALLAAPAGRGKSALLLRWCQQLLTRPDLTVVYFPVSIRFRTNLASVIFPALVALLARLHGESLPTDPHTSSEVWHGLLNEYITRPLPDNRQLLLVLDGLDEAADWDAGPWLFPQNPPDNLRVIVSARYLANDQDASAWLNRLGWERTGLAHTLELYPLDRSGIASVLVQMGFPLNLLGTRVDIVAELHRLSEGDPLLIRLYVDDLWERGDTAIRLTPEDLHAIRPGLTGYFGRWWQEQRSLWEQETPQREVTVQTVLSLLAGALGPLSKEDLLKLAPDDPVLKPGQVEKYLEPLRRFVIGDGSRQGYVFSHPRLASYFLEEHLSEAERQEIEQRFLTWGVQTLIDLNADRLDPAQASPYIVRYYGAHLERAGADTRSLFALVSNGWRRAWEKLDRVHAGFLGDSERAWHAAERGNAVAITSKQPTPYLDVEICCLLCRVSVNSMTNNISPRLMREAVKTGVWTPAQGLASVRLLTDPIPRVRELVALAPSTPEPLRSDILQEAIDTLATLKHARDRLDTLVELAPGLSAGLLEQVLETVQTLEDEADRAGVLAELAPTLAISPALVQKALLSAQTIEEEEYLVLALEGLAPVLSTEQLQHTLHLTRAIEDERYRAQAFTALIPYLPTSFLPEILNECHSMRAGSSQLHLLAQLVGTLPEAARDEALQETLALLNELLDQEYRVTILLKIAPFLPAERLQRILPEIQALWDESERTRALRALLPHLPTTQLSTFLDTTLALKNEEQRVAVLSTLLPRLPTTLLEIVLTSVPAIWDEGLRVELLAQLAPHVNTDLLPKILEMVHAISDPGYRVWLLAELETSLDGQSHHLDIAQTFLDMRNTNERIQTLLAIVARVSDEALTRIFSIIEPEIFGFYRSLHTPDLQADIFTKLAPRMPKAWLARALRRINVLEHETSQVQALIALAPRIDEQLLPDALECVRSMKAPELRAQVLDALVASLTEENKGEKVREMVQVLQIIKDDHERVTLFAAFIEHLDNTFPTDALAAALTAVAAMRSERHQARVLEGLASHLADNQFATVLHAARALQNEEERSRVLDALAQHLPERSIPSFFASVQTLQDEHRRVNVLMILATRVSPATFTGLLALAQDIQDQRAQMNILGVLATHLPESTFPQFWDVLQQTQNQGKRAWLLNALAAHVPPEYFAPFWTALETCENQNWQMRTLKTLAEHTPEDRFPQLWTAIQQNSDDQWLTVTIHTLAPYIPVSFFPQVFQVALTLPMTPSHTHMDNLKVESDDALEALAETVPESFFLQFWHKAHEMENKWQRVRLLQRLAMHVPDRYFAEVWNTVNQVEKMQQQQLYERLVAQTPERIFNQIWQWAKAIEDPWQQNKWLLALSSRVPESFIPQFWQSAKEVKDSQKQAHILTALLPKLPRDIQTEIIEISMENHIPRLTHAAILLSLTGLLNTEQSEILLARLLPAEWSEEKLAETFRNMPQQYGWWETIMVALLPQLSKERWRTVLPVLLNVVLGRSKADENRADTLMKLVGRVSEEMLPTVLEAAWSLQMEQGQENVLRTLLSSSTLTTNAWLRVLEQASEKTRASGETRYLRQVLHTAPVSIQQTRPEHLYTALHNILHMLAQRPRQEALAELVSLEPALRVLGGKETLIATACATLEIGYWWP